MNDEIEINFTNIADSKLFGNEDIENIEKKYEYGEGDNVEPISSKASLLHNRSTKRKSGMRVISPPYNMNKLGSLPEISPKLKTCIEAMAVNIGRFPGKIVCNIKIVERTVVDPETGEETSVKINEKTGEVLDDAKLNEIEEDYMLAHKFISSCCLDHSFSELMFRTRIDYETYANAYWEFTKDNAGDNYVGISKLRTEEVRLCERQEETVEIKQFVLNKHNFDFWEIDRLKRFRRFVQTNKKGKKIYYKEFGDPRRMNAIDGDYLSKEEEPEAGKKWIEATEVLHWRMYNPRYEYGVPRFTARTVHILGSRAADLVQYMYLKSNGIPPAILIVEGYRGKELKTRVEEWIKAKKEKGDIFGSLLVLEAEPQSGGAAGSGAKALKPNMRIEKLNNVFSKDAMFQEYTKENDKGIVSSFRLTNQFVGATEDLNRAVAETADEIVQKQVFIPERMGQDEIINENIFNGLRLKYHRYESAGVTLEDAEKIAKLAIEFGKAGALDVNEMREVASETLGRKYEDKGEKKNSLSTLELSEALKNPDFLNDILNIEMQTEDKEEANSDVGATSESGTAEEKEGLEKNWTPIPVSEFDADNHLGLLQNLIQTQEKIKIHKASILNAEKI